MTASQAQLNANRRYRQRAVKTVNIQFFPKDHDLVEYLSAAESKAGLIKQLVRADMERAIAAGEYVKPDVVGEE